MDSREGADTVPVSLHKYLYAGADPVDGADPSGYGFLSDFTYGRLVHREIGNDYMDSVGGCSDSTVTALVTSSFDVANCGRPRKGFSGDLLVRPDLADPRTGKGGVYEIKPVNSALLAVPEAVGYLELLKVSDYRVPPGRSTGTLAERESIRPQPRF